MARICLTLPTNRACAATIAAVHEEAVHAAAHFGAEVHFLILDSAADRDRAGHAAAVAGLPRVPGVVVHHLGEAEQRTFLAAVLRRARVAGAEKLLRLLLPDAVSYGACTDRAFLLAAALGCRSVHRRDSDSRYQTAGGRPVFPVHHELATLGLPAADAARRVDTDALNPQHAHKPVSLVGASFVGEMSVDIAEIHDLDPAVYHDVVSLWAPPHWPEEHKRALVEESFKGAGTEAFGGDHAVLGAVDPMRVDMCNVAFHRGVYEAVPLPPATDTIGSDYFLLHLVHDATLPGVLHNRHIVNYHTDERKTGAGFTAYQMRFAKFLLSMRYFNVVYDELAAAGAALLDDRHRPRAAAVGELVARSARLDRDENVMRLTALEIAYRKLGGRYAEFAGVLAARAPDLPAEAARDMADFALLIAAWEPLVRASAATDVPGTAR
ncbi:DUF6271 family protein [Streptomyces sp. NBC_01808]|uniref:DUF6271 family protein n=1 Tax=Streptomyces sp. NBC_01808 TaxID=2975947 RepID=UPI002DDADF3D|nr:DUF6271 family protein [Streptomyces sp. NBC_01808]WSA41818.1 DUF6271 family protein [Streptomyces sp. NBC_01808]